MKKFSLLFALICVWAWSDTLLRADDVAPTQPSIKATPAPKVKISNELINQKLLLYHQTLLTRVESPENTAQQPWAIKAALANLSESHNVLLQENFVLKWNSNTEESGTPEIWQNNVQLPLTTALDQYGRITFATPNQISGSIDVTDGLVVINLTLGANSYTLLGTLVQQQLPPHPDGSPGATFASVTMMAKTQCTCKGSENQCSDPQNDCANAQPCTYTKPSGGTENSNCKWLKVTDSYAVSQSLPVGPGRPLIDEPAP